MWKGRGLIWDTVTAVGVEGLRKIMINLSSWLRHSSHNHEFKPEALLLELTCWFFLVADVWVKDFSWLQFKVQTLIIIIIIIIIYVWFTVSVHHALSWKLITVKDKCKYKKWLIFGRVIWTVKFAVLYVGLSPNYFLSLRSFLHKESTGHLGTVSISSK
jgi:hypothetical protein